MDKGNTGNSVLFLQLPANYTISKSFNLKKGVKKFLAKKVKNTNVQLKHSIPTQ